MRADSETEIVRILTEAGYWSDKRVWRLYGDMENNFSTIGNQQNRPDAALVEKLINSADARLMHECLSRGLNPKSPAAPQSIRDAVARFFEEGRRGGSIYGGQIRAWDNEMRREVAKGITLAATGAKPRKVIRALQSLTRVRDKPHAGSRNVSLAGKIQQASHSIRSGKI